MFKDYLTLFFPLVVVIIGMFFLLNTSEALSKRRDNITKIILVLVFFVSISIVLYRNSRSVIGQTIYMVVSYIIRPFLPFGLLILFNGDKKWGKGWILLSLPLLANFLVYLLPFFTKVVFYINDDLQFVRGPLGFFCHFICYIYLVMVLVVTVRTTIVDGIFETLVIFFDFAIVLVANILEMALGIDGILWTTTSICVIFYYLSLYMQAVRRDALTDVFNRRAFYTDINKHKNNINGVISIDMNGLKSINDNSGHKLGDDALCRLAKAIVKSLPKNMRVYRIGGDEFVVVCRSVEECDIKTTINNVISNTTKANVSCAIGYGFGENDLEELEKIADANMYQNKMEYYCKNTSQGE